MADELEQQNEETFTPTETGETKPQEAGATPTHAAQPDELKSAMAELAKTVGGLAAKSGQNGGAAQQSQPMSEEEKNKLWAVYQPNDDFFKKWMRIAADADPNEVNSTIAERKALFGEMQQGLVKQSVVGARNLLQIEMAKLREELAPVMDHYNTAKGEALRGRFYSAYPALDDDKYRSVIDAVSRTLSDKTFNDENSYFKALAESAGGSIKGLVPDFDLAAKPDKTKTAVTSPRLPRTSVGGTGGTGKGAERTQEKKADDDSAELEWMK